MEPDHARSGSGSYEEIWPGVAARLRRALQLRGIPESRCEDLVQETAARLWERWSSFDTRTDVFPLALIIARNLATDAARKDARLELRPIVENPSGDDPPAIALGRMELNRVLQTVMGLTPRYRDLLLAEAGLAADPLDESGGVVTNMARMRARRRLRTIVERTGAVVVLPLRRLKEGVCGWGGAGRFQAGSFVPTWMLEVVIACILTIVGGSAINEAVNHRPVNVVQGLVRNAAEAKDRGSLGSGVNRHRLRARGGGAGSGTQVQTGNPEKTEPSLSLGELPHSKGGSEEKGSFGAEGYDLQGSGDAEVGDQELKWEHRQRYRTPRCVRRLGEGELSTDCSGGRPPRGSVEVEWEGRKTRVEYGE